MQSITAVAIRFYDKRGTANIIAVPMPGRHPDAALLCSNYNLNPYAFEGVEYGFLTDDQQFLGREDAYVLAASNGQLAKRFEPKALYSEDIW